MPPSKRVFCSAPLLVCLLAAQSAGPQPPVVDPGGHLHAPSDAVVLFDGRTVKHWTRKDGSPTGCRVEDHTMACTTGSGDAYSVPKFADAQIHIEFQPPLMADHHGQLRGNSGVYLQGRYELQVLDSYHNETYAKGHLGALYGQAPPLVNAARPPGQWQAYDIIFHPHRCDASGSVIRKGTITVLLNDVLIHDNVEIENTKGGCEPGPLMLQDHSGFPGAPKTVMHFRNIWYRPLAPRP